MSPLTSASCVWNSTREPSGEAYASDASNVPLPLIEPIDNSVVVPPWRWYTSRQGRGSTSSVQPESVSDPTSASAVSRKTFVPSVEEPTKSASKAPFPGEICVVVAPLRS